MCVCVRVCVHACAGACARVGGGGGGGNQGSLHLLFRYIFMFKVKEKRPPNFEKPLR